ncbi:hypothetical protein GZL_02467 [Streptomyces sp. 769]|nr:hypothetical protein GZL_02467 [Streptomyces sp. 769]
MADELLVEIVELPRGLDHELSHRVFDAIGFVERV